jgi:hypothetical protein
MIKTTLILSCYGISQDSYDHISTEIDPTKFVTLHGDARDRLGANVNCEPLVIQILPEDLDDMIAGLERNHGDITPKVAAELKTFRDSLEADRVRRSKTMTGLNAMQEDTVIIFYI